MKTLLIVLTASLALLVALTLSVGVGQSKVAARENLPYTFYFTHYELLGDLNSPDGVRYHSNGQPFAKAPDGSEVILSGKGGWNPRSKTTQGGGQYTIEDASGGVKSRGSWRVTGFSSF